MVMTFRQKIKPSLSKEIKGGNFVRKENIMVGVDRNVIYFADTFEQS